MSTTADVAKNLHKAFSLAFDKLQGKTILQGTVLKVNGYSTCDVELQPDLVLYDVRMNAIDGGFITQFTVKPKEGSKVLVAVIENVKTEAVLIACSDVDEVYAKIGTAEFKVREGKIMIAAGGKNLKTEFHSFIDEVAKIIVLYGRSPNVAALNQIKDNISDILE